MKSLIPSYAWEEQSNWNGEGIIKILLYYNEAGIASLISGIGEDSDGQ